MKKIISSILCLILAVVMLVGCSDDVIGAYIEKYPKPEEKEDISLNLYVICDDKTSDNAKVTVSQRIADYTSGKYDTTVNVVYSSASEYEGVVRTAIAAGKADIVLINSQSLMNELYTQSLLANLTEYIKGDTYGTLNARIATALLNAYAIDDQLYCVPNNHVIGEYTYLVVNRNMAEYFYMGSPSELASFDTVEEYASLKTLFETDGDLSGAQTIKNQLLEAGLVTDLDINAPIDSYVNIVTGMYEDKAAWEAVGYACNVVSMPTVSLDNYSAYAILSNTVNVERAMEIVYALNTDETFHNYLQYGISGTNYMSYEEGYVVRMSGENDKNSFYYMNPLYTGDIFASYYCEELGWDENAKYYGNLQNHEAVFVKAETAE